MKILKTIILPLVFFLALGCSSANNPTTPSGENATYENTQVAIGITGDTADIPWGVYSGYINIGTLDAEFLPSRNASAIGDVFDTDITQFLMFSPCWNCIRISSVDVDSSGNVILSIAVKHPIDNINIRPDLHAFDVRGIMILPADTNFDIGYPPPDTGGLLPLIGNALTVINPDGMTTHFDEIAGDINYFNPPKEIDGNLNPFKRYFTDPSTPAFDPFIPVGHNVFPAESGWETQEYIINSSQIEGTIEFVFVLDASYGHSAVYTTRDNPEYYLPNYNRKEAWRVDVAITDNSLAADNITSTAAIQVDVYDWQAGRTVDPNYPDSTHPGGIPYTSDVTSVRLSVPGLFNGELSETTPISGNGVWGDPYIFDFTFTNDKAALVGDYPGLVSVRDELWGQSGPYAVSQPPSGFPYDGPDIRDYSAYQVFIISISDPWDIKPDPFPGTSNVFFGTATAKGDFNNDGIEDLAVSAPGADPSGTIFVYFGNGSSLDEPPVALNSEESILWNIGHNVAAGRMDEDEIDDIVALSDNGAVAVWLSDGTGGFAEPIFRKDSVGSLEGYGWDLSLGKLNNDNFGDIVTGHPHANIAPDINAGKVLIYMFDGVSIPAPVGISFDPVTAGKKYGACVALAKVNSDQYDDLLVKHNCEIIPGEYYDVEIALSDGSGGAYSRQSLRTLFPNLNSYYIGTGIEVVDLDDDGTDEWIIGAEMNPVNGVNNAGEFFIFYPDGNNGFNGYTRHQNGDPETSDRLAQFRCATGDLNGDGVLDIIVPTLSGGLTDGEVQVFLASPGGYEYYKKYTEIPGLTHYYRFSRSILAMDIDGNGDDELIIGSRSDSFLGHLYIYFNP